MSLSPDSSIVRRSIDLKYANRQRAASFKWIFINGALFLAFTLDLWFKCPGHTSALHYVEACLAAGACASAARHALRLAARGPRGPAAALSVSRRRLLGLAAEPLDSSFCLVSEDEDEESQGAERAAEPGSLAAPAGRGRRASPAPRAASPAPPGPARAPRDEFIADADHLERYLSSAAAAAASDAGGEEAGYAGAPPPAYQLAACAEQGEPAAQPPAGAPPAPWRRLHLDPARLAHFNLNLRRWLHETILARLVREMDAVDALLAGAGLEARVGAAPAQRLEALAGSRGEAAPRLRALLPFLRPFADQAYVARRVRDLARGGCLAAYRWAGGGAGWGAAHPPDAELVLHLFAAYLDGVVPGGGGAFSAAHVSSAPAPPPRGPGVLALHRAARAPPHYVVAAGRAVLDAGAGRDNLLHSLLVFLGAAARRDPPALLRLHLGPAGLNMLWILER